MRVNDVALVGAFMILACGPNVAEPVEPMDAIEVDLSFVRVQEDRAELVGVRLEDGAEVVLAASAQGLFSATPRAWSFDGRLVAIGRSDGVVVLDVAGHEQHVIAGAREADWSPIERKLAYHRSLAPAGEELRVLDFDAGEDRRVSADRSGNTWMPGGELLVAPYYDDACLLYRIDPPSKKRSCVFESSRGVSGVHAIAAGADRIAFVMAESVAEDRVVWPLHVMRSDGGDPRRVLDYVSPLSSASWSADGASLAAERIIAEDNGGPVVVTVLDPNGEVKQAFEPNSVEPVFASDRDALAFVDGSDAARIVVVDGEDEIWRSSFPPGVRTYERFPSFRPH